MTILVPDAEARKTALDPTQSFLCEAPAGSGKTELLTQRFLKLLSRVERPEEILAITFTRKATGEMRERLLGALHLGEGEPPQESHKYLTWQLARDVLRCNEKYAWHLLQNPNRLQIKTFDSLCATLTRMMPFESSFGAQPSIDGNIDKLYLQAVRALLASLEENPPWLDALKTLLALLDNRFDQCEALLISLLKSREQWMPLMVSEENTQYVREVLERHLQHVIYDALARLEQRIPVSLHGALVNVVGFAASNVQNESDTSPILACLNLDVDNAALPSAGLEALPCWLGIAEIFLTATGGWRKKVDKRIGFPAGKTKAEKAVFSERKADWKTVVDALAACPGVLDALVELRCLPSANYDTKQWRVLEALFKLLPTLAGLLTLQFKEKNTVDFSEISMAASRALGEVDSPSALALKLDYQIKHILVDEFQDTSVGQVDLINKLTAGWEPGDNRTLFCVGDAMQSIYGFRGANVGLFIHCRDNGLPNVDLTPIQLTANFRSSAAVVNWVNNTFSASFPNANDIGSGAVRYSPSDAIHPGDIASSISAFGFCGENVETQEAEKVLALIQRERNENPQARIAILVRSRGHVSHILPMLKSNCIPYRAVDMETLDSHSVIQDLIALTRALLHPADKLAWLAVLRAPWCGLDLLDLEKIVGITTQGGEFVPTVLAQCATIFGEQCNGVDHADQIDLFLAQTLPTIALSAHGRARLVNVFTVLRVACEQRNRKHFRDWVEGTWLQLGGPACVSELVDLENAQVYFELLERWPYANDLPSLAELMLAVAQLYALPDPNANESLQVMTIHKSKGLEFDTVIIPSLHKGARASDSELLLWHERIGRDGHNEWLMAPLTKEGKDKHPTYRYLQIEQGKKLAHERGRLLYVACTRAKQKLHLLTKVESVPDAGVTLPAQSSNSLASVVWQEIKAQIIVDNPVLGDTKAVHNNKLSELLETETNAAPELLRLSGGWELPKFSTKNILEQFVNFHGYRESDNAIDITWRSPTPKWLGTVVHRFIQRIADEGIAEWPKSKVVAQKNNLRSMFRNIGVGISESALLAERAVTMLLGFIALPAVQRLLSAQLPFAENEYAITVSSADGPQSLVIDRLVQDSDGVTWILDYKTSEPLPGEKLDVFIENQKSLYADKMRLYKRALTSAGFSGLKTALLFPAIGEFVELE